MNPYEILEVQPSASIDEIKKSYRKLARTHHPDKGGDLIKFQQLAKAYDILSNPVSRERYDTTGETDKPDFSKKFQHFFNEVLMKHFDSIENVEHENPVKVFTKVITETSKHDFMGAHWRNPEDELLGMEEPEKIFSVVHAPKTSIKAIEIGITAHNQ